MNNAIRNRTLATLAVLALSLPATAQVTATAGWARATPPGAKVAAAYLTLANSGEEESRLLKVTSPVSDQINLHRTSITETGVARMWPLALLAVPAGGTLHMDPGGVHVMFNALKAPLVAGQKIPLTLKFDGGQPEFTVMLEVRPLTATADEHANH